MTLTNGFYLGKYPVTQGQYLAVVGSNPSYFQTIDANGNPISPDLNRPVEQVSWNDATNYCVRLTQSDRVAGRIPSTWGYRLPTEAEREYACRAGTTTAFHFGSAIHGGMANFDGRYEYDAATYYGEIIITNSPVWLQRTTTVGSYAANAYGVYDMHGNVMDWCQDLYGVARVVRGGTWASQGRTCRSAFRTAYDATSKVNYVGFRVVLAPGQP